MAALFAAARPAAFRAFPYTVPRTASRIARRPISTLPTNPHIYVHEPSGASKNYTLSLLSTTPVTPSLAIGSSPTNPPTPDNFTENPNFLDLVHHVIATHACSDPEVQAQASLYASQAGSTLGSGGVFFPNQPQSQKKRRRSKSEQAQSYSGGGGADGDGAGGASSQGGMGGAGRGGYIHVSDQRNPPDFGRVAWPEDIFGSLEIDGNAKFVDGDGRYQRSGTYRVVTREGVLGLSSYLRGKVVEKLRELEGQMKS